MGEFTNNEENSKFKSNNLSLPQKLARLGVIGGLFAASGTVSGCEKPDLDAVKTSTTDTLKDAGEHLERQFLTEEQKIASIIENSTVKKWETKAGFGVEQFVDDTGWTGEYSNDTLVATIKSLKENEDVNFDNLQPGTDVYIPIKNLE